MLIMQEIKNR